MPYRDFFILDEESLRRLEGILQDASSQIQPNPTVVYRVEREDNRFYETVDIAKVLQDANIDGKRIHTVSIELRDPAAQGNRRPAQDWIVQVTFKRNKREIFSTHDDVNLRIASDNLTWALKWSDELDPQVMRTLRAKKTSRWLLGLFVIPFLVLIVRTSQSYEDTATSGCFVLIATVLAAFLAIWMSSTERFSRWFGPRSGFLWGEEARDYKDWEDTRKRIVWGIFVAFIISVAASVGVAVSIP